MSDNDETIKMMYPFLSSFDNPDSRKWIVFSMPVFPPWIAISWKESFGKYGGLLTIRSNLIFIEVVVSQHIRLIFGFIYFLQYIKELKSMSVAITFLKFLDKKKEYNNSTIKIYDLKKWEN